MIITPSVNNHSPLDLREAVNLKKFTLKFKSFIGLMFFIVVGWGVVVQMVYCSKNGQSARAVVEVSDVDDTELQDLKTTLNGTIDSLQDKDGIEIYVLKKIKKKIKKYIEKILLNIEITQIKQNFIKSVIGLMNTIITDEDNVKKNIENFEVLLAYVSFNVLSNIKYATLFNKLISKITQKKDNLSQEIEDHVFIYIYLLCLLHSDPSQEEDYINSYEKYLDQVSEESSSKSEENIFTKIYKKLTIVCKSIDLKQIRDIDTMIYKTRILQILSYIKNPSTEERFFQSLINFYEKITLQTKDNSILDTTLFFLQYFFFNLLDNTEENVENEQLTQKFIEEHIEEQVDSYCNFLKSDEAILTFDKAKKTLINLVYMYFSKLNEVQYKNKDIIYKEWINSKLLILLIKIKNMITKKNFIESITLIISQKNFSQKIDSLNVILYKIFDIEKSIKEDKNFEDFLQCLNKFIVQIFPASQVEEKNASETNTIKKKNNNFTIFKKIIELLRLGIQQGCFEEVLNIMKNSNDSNDLFLKLQNFIPIEHKKIQYNQYRRYYTNNSFYEAPIPDSSSDIESESEEGTKEGKVKEEYVEEVEEKKEVHVEEVEKKKEVHVEEVEEKKEVHVEEVYVEGKKIETIEKRLERLEAILDRKSSEKTGLETTLSTKLAEQERLKKEAEEAEQERLRIEEENKKIVAAALEKQTALEEKEKIDKATKESLEEEDVESMDKSVDGDPKLESLESPRKKTLEEKNNKKASVYKTGFIVAVPSSMALLYKNDPKVRRFIKKNLIYLAQSTSGRKFINLLPNKVKIRIYKKIKNQWAVDKSNHSLEKTQTNQSKKKQSQTTQSQTNQSKKKQSKKDGSPKKTIDSSQQSSKFIESQIIYNGGLLVN